MANDKAVCVSGLSDNKPPSSYFTIRSYVKIKVNVITCLWLLNRHTSHEINFHFIFLSHYKVQHGTCPQSVVKTSQLDKDETSPGASPSDCGGSTDSLQEGISNPKLLALHSLRQVLLRVQWLAKSEMQRMCLFQNILAKT